MQMHKEINADDQIKRMSADFRISSRIGLGGRQLPLSCLIVRDAVV